MTDRPNIIVIMSDEHDPAVMGCYGDPLDPTPNLDRLASQGVAFDQAYTTCPLCAPARHSFTAGQYVSRCGAWSNQCGLPSADYPSIPRLLGRAGYRSYLCGKMHYDRNRRYGFEEVFPHRGNSKPLSGGTSRRAPDDDRISHQQWTARSATFRTVPDSQPFRADPSVSECDAYVTAQAVAFLREHAHDREPFFLLVGYHAPHFPLDVPESYFNTFRGRVPMPRIGPETWASMPPHYRHRNSIHGVTASIPPELIRRGRECYWALVRWLDDQIGMLLKAAAGLSAADNTVIVYTTDHGENKGDHGMWWKLCMYEHAARVPLLVRWPRRWPGGQRRRGACTLVDLARAVLDLGGAQQPENWDGASLLPWLDDPAYPWRDVAVSECYGDNISGYSMIRRGRFKYVYFTRPTPHAQPHRQLFDIEADPDEAVNLADRPEHAATIARLHADLVAEVGRDPEEIERLARMAARTKEKPPLNAAL